MKAVVINEYGDRNELHMTNLAIPEIADDEVLVEVKATSVNPIDWKLREGYLAEAIPLKFPIVLGWDVAGKITRTGSAVKDFHAGDKILARPDLTDRGTYAEYTAVKEDKLALLPENVSYEDAAALPLAGLTAWQCIYDYLKVQPGQTVLVQGGAGGVGLFAIQILKHIGAKVITTASPANFDLLKDLGADQIIDYHTEDFSQVLSNIDAVFDTIGGDILSKSYGIIKPEGSLVTTAGAADEDLAKANHINASGMWLHPNGKQLTELVDLVSRGVVKVVTDSVHPFTEDGVKDAQAVSEGMHAKGKIVISMQKS
ncbi:NADP-dependent oxidoreductase [Companilactobacillus ginsenosidimutans]|uniref:NADPH:quinone reductase n=1 Tax=Companilactobacillus ginsenosidimutans TaxID=1007676 RepID=A0A0H4R287_9LACO|nr:NADP-dependent oxidoreductase [Companilactobacillus ginsenosidimutans]AKP67850.1 NADPH:quinone reductase [Companilactobacillus ginsenosidimutans]